MRSRARTISIFSMSALDLFAAALGAFILIVLVLFPYYNKGGTDQSLEELEELVVKRRELAATEQTESAQIRVLRAEIQLLERQYRTAQENMSEVEAETQELLDQIAEIEIPDPPPEPKPVEEPPTPPRSVNRGVEFSILGLATSEKRIAIVVDMSGSMQAHTAKVTQAINEVLDQMKPDNEFLILGYRGGPTFTAWPPNGGYAAATPANLTSARDFVSAMPRRFGGGTPTQAALLRALNTRPEAIILMSDGAPDDGLPGNIIANVSLRNRGQGGAEIHTVAIGDYTEDQALTRFLQERARNNEGDFVGRAR